MIGQTLNNRHEITSRIGKGAMGIVYRATDSLTRQEVAIKVIAGDLALDPEVLERFKREGEALRKLKHPNIVGYLDAFYHDEQYVIVMEYVPGGSLLELLKSGPLPIDRARQIALDLCDALIRAHRLNIIHRDIKPENILIDEDGTPKLADFGVARLNEGTRMTRTGTQVGTPYYMAPEAWEGQSLDAQADIWSLGVILFEMLTGQVPFGGDTGAAVMNKVLTTTAPDMRKLRAEVPANLVKIIGRMLARDRRRRYATMREVAVELERDQQIESSIKKSKSTKLESKPNIKSRIWLSIGLVAIFPLIWLTWNYQINVGPKQTTTVESNQVSTSASPSTPEQNLTTATAPNSTDITLVLSCSQEPVQFEENEHFYQIVCVEGGIDWVSAELAAKSAGGYLATITSSSENVFVSNLISDPYWGNGESLEGPWIGGLQPDCSPEPSCGWRWLNDEEMLATYWIDGEPNNDGGAENRLVMFNFGSENELAFWNDISSELEMKGYIVEWDNVEEITSQAISSPDPRSSTTDQQAYDNFNNSATDGDYDQTLWDIVYGNSPTPRQANGQLTFSLETPPTVTREISLTAKGIGSPLLREIRSIQADMGFGGETNSGFSHIAINMIVPNTAKGDYWIEANLVNSGDHPVLLCLLAYYDTIQTKVYESAYDNNLTYGQNYTVRIELDPQTANLTWYLDDERVCNHQSDETATLLNRNVNVYVNSLRDRDSVAITYLDNVFISLEP